MLRDERRTEQLEPLARYFRHDRGMFRNTTHANGIRVANLCRNSELVLISRDRMVHEKRFVRVSSAEPVDGAHVRPPTPSPAS